jgi:eukaryotic-like serine/threonine-protein kinase
MSAPTRAGESSVAGYTLLERLAKGGMAEVFRAKASPEAGENGGDAEVVVLKRLLPEFRAEQGYISSFLDEGKLCVRLNHPNIARTMKVFKKGADYFMVQEFVEGASLMRVLEAARARGTPIELAGAVHVAMALARALEYVHQARRADDSGATIVHRDVNPANILCGRSGVVKITDFGIAEVEGQSQIGATGTIKGTLNYLSPEAVLGRGVDRRSDLYAAGIVMWEMVANQPLFSGASELEVMHKIREGRTPVLNKVRKDLPELLVQIVRKALFADPSLRFQSANELYRALSVLVARANLENGDQALAHEVESVVSAPAAKSKA